MRLDVGLQDRVHAALVAGAGGTEPFQHIDVYAQGYLLLGLFQERGGLQASRSLKERIVQRQIVGVLFGCKRSCRVRHIFQPLPARL